MELSFGEQVKVILKRKNMTIKQLAAEIEAQTGMKMSRQNLTQRLTRDNFQEQDMRMIASVLGCAVSLSLVDASEEAGQIAASRPENEKSIDLQDAVNHQLTIEEVVKAAGREPLLEAAEEKALKKAEETAHKEAEAAEETEKEKPAPKRRITVRDLANKAREERLRREAQLLEESRKRAALKEEQDRRQAEQKAAEDARRLKLKAVEEAKALEEAKAAEEARQAKLAAQREQEKAEQERLENMTEEEKAARAKAEEEEKERIREIAKRAVAASRREEEKKPAAAAVPVIPPEMKTSEETADDEVSAEEEGEEALSSEASDMPAGDINPRTGEEYESNVVRSHPSLVGYIQVYDRSEHKWIDMTEWAFLGFQERKKVLLGAEYEPPVYLD